MIDVVVERERVVTGVAGKIERKHHAVAAIKADGTLIDIADEVARRNLVVEHSRPSRSEATAADFLHLGPFDPAGEVVNICTVAAADIEGSGFHIGDVIESGWVGVGVIPRQIVNVFVPGRSNGVRAGGRLQLLLFYRAGQIGAGERSADVMDGDGL